MNQQIFLGFRGAAGRLRARRRKTGGILILLLISVLARAGDTFSLQTESNRVMLSAGRVTVQTHPDSLMFAWRGPYGTLLSAVGNETLIRLAAIKVTRDDSQEKCVTLSSYPARIGEGTHQFAVRLEAWRGRPGVRITVEGNVGFFKLCPILADYYSDPAGEQHAARDKIPVTPWMFWPASNTTGGYGIVFSDPPCIRMITLYPRADWRKAGWYLMPAARAHTDCPTSGGAPVIRFWLMPAVTPREVAAMCQQMQDAAE